MPPKKGKGRAPARNDPGVGSSSATRGSQAQSSNRNKNTKVSFAAQPEKKSISSTQRRKLRRIFNMTEDTAEERRTKLEELEEFEMEIDVNAQDDDMEAAIARLEKTVEVDVSIEQEAMRGTLVLKSLNPLAGHSEESAGLPEPPDSPVDPSPDTRTSGQFDQLTSSLQDFGGADDTRRINAHPAAPTAYSTRGRPDGRPAAPSTHGNPGQNIRNANTNNAPRNQLDSRPNVQISPPSAPIAAGSGPATSQVHGRTSRQNPSSAAESARNSVNVQNPSQPSRTNDSSSVAAPAARPPNEQNQIQTPRTNRIPHPNIANLPAAPRTLQPAGQNQPRAPTSGGPPSQSDTTDRSTRSQANASNSAATSASLPSNVRNTIEARTLRSTPPLGTASSSAGHQASSFISAVQETESPTRKRRNESASPPQDLWTHNPAPTAELASHANAPHVPTQYRRDNLQVNAADSLRLHARDGQGSNTSATSQNSGGGHQAQDQAQPITSTSSHQAASDIDEPMATGQITADSNNVGTVSQDAPASQDPETLYSNQESMLTGNSAAPVHAESGQGSNDSAPSQSEGSGYPSQDQPQHAAGDDSYQASSNNHERTTIDQTAESSNSEGTVSQAAPDIQEQEASNGNPEQMVVDDYNTVQPLNNEEDPGGESYTSHDNAEDGESNVPGYEHTEDTNESEADATPSQTQGAQENGLDEGDEENDPRSPDAITEPDFRASRETRLGMRARGWRKRGFGKQAVIQLGPRNAATYRLEPGSKHRASIDQAGLPDLSADRRGGKPDWPITRLKDMFHGIKAVAWRVIDPNRPLDGMNPDLRIVDERWVRYTDSLVEFEWRDQVRTWEPRTLARAVFGILADEAIFQRAVYQEKIYGQWRVRQGQGAPVSLTTAPEDGAHANYHAERPAARRSPSAMVPPPRRRRGGRRTNGRRAIADAPPSEHDSEQPESESEREVAPRQSASRSSRGVAARPSSRRHQEQESEDEPEPDSGSNSEPEQESEQESEREDATSPVARQSEARSSRARSIAPQSTSRQRQRVRESEPRDSRSSASRHQQSGARTRDEPNRRERQQETGTSRTSPSRRRQDRASRRGLPTPPQTPRYREHDDRSTPRRERAETPATGEQSVPRSSQRERQRKIGRRVAAMTWQDDWRRAKGIGLNQDLTLQQSRVMMAEWADYLTTPR